MPALGDEQAEVQRRAGDPLRGVRRVPRSTAATVRRGQLDAERLGRAGPVADQEGEVAGAHADVRDVPEPVGRRRGRRRARRRRPARAPRSPSAGRSPSRSRSSAARTTAASRPPGHGRRACGQRVAPGPPRRPAGRPAAGSARSAAASIDVAVELGQRRAAARPGTAPASVAASVATSSVQARCADLVRDRPALRRAWRGPSRRRAAARRGVQVRALGAQVGEHRGDVSHPASLARRGTDKSSLLACFCRTPIAARRRATRRSPSPARAGAHRCGSCRWPARATRSRSHVSASAAPCADLGVHLATVLAGIEPHLLAGVVGPHQQQRRARPRGWRSSVRAAMPRSATARWR